MMTQPDMASIQKRAGIATLAILGSRIFGLVREQIFAFFFGASYALDAYNAAFRIPNLLRDLFAEGALSQSFITVFAQKSAREKSDTASWRLANHVFGFLFVVLGIFVVLGWIFAPQIVHLIAQGFNAPTHALAVTLTRWLMPFILFVSLAALSMGMLNAKNRYFLPQSASTFFNLSSIVIGLATAWWMAPDYVMAPASPDHASQLPRAITGMAIGTLAGGVVQWLVQQPSLHGLGFRLRPRLNLRDPDLRAVLKLTAPAIIGAASVQVNVMVNTFFASHMAEGSISHLNFAFRIMQFPLGVFGVAVATVSAPLLAGLIAQNRTQDFLASLKKSISLSLFLAIPSTLGILILARPIMALIYEHGRFDAQDTLASAQALQGYAVGIAGYSLLKIYQPAFMACGDAKTPMKISLFSIVFNFSFNWFFASHLKWPAWSLALGTAIVATTSIVMQAWLFRHKVSRVWDRELITSALKSSTSALVMAGVGYGLYPLVSDKLGNTHLLEQAMVMLIVLGACALVYFGTAWILGMPELRVVTQKLRKRSND